MAKIFISYTKKDLDILSSLQQSLISLGHEIVYDDVILKAGQNWEAAMNTAIRDADGTIFIFTENSVSSQYMMKEFGIAETMAADNGKFLIPVVNGEPSLPDFVKSKQYIKFDDPDLINKIQKVILSHSTVSLQSSAVTGDTVSPAAKTTSGQKASKRREKRTLADANFWFLKLNPKTWTILDFEKYVATNEEALFGVHNLNNERRVEYELYYQVKKGDMIIGYAFDEKRAVECLFEVAEGVHNTKEAGEVISMKFVKLVSPPIPLDYFYDVLPFKDKLEAEAPERLFAVTKEIYDAILASDKFSYGTQAAYLSNYTTEGDHFNTKDQLSFTADIESFGTVICLEKVKPPLAIGLFGKWGSGKSFFMEKLSEYIDKLSLKDERYVNNVVQVKFNSWHYSDANLWASLITEIFESLSVFASKNEKLNEIEKLSATLQLTNMHKEEAEQRKKELIKTISVLKNDQEEKRKKLEDISGLNLLKMAFLDPKIKGDIDKLNAGGLESIKENRVKLDGYFEEVQSFWNRVSIFINQLLSLKGRKWWWLIGIAIFVFLGTYLVNHFYADEWAKFSLWSSAKLAVYVAAAGKFFEAILSYKGLFDKINERWTSLKKTIDERPQVTDETLSDHERELVKVTNSLAEIGQKLIQTKKEIADISTGKKLLEFIDNKSRDEVYSKQLGLIAWIRKDFQTLDKLLREQHLANEDGKAKVVIDNPQDVKLEIDRIVLYIDDLDRCNEEIVVKVLEAIHLLLAFPLFVVVVGVDPRWLNNALNKKYDELFNPKSGATQKKAITSYDYLEKIFQIPFALKEATSTDRDRLLDYLMRDEIIKQEKQAEQEKKETGKEKETGTDNTQNEKEDEQSEGDNAADDTKKEQEKENAKQVLNKVNFREDEIAYMKSISGMFGQTPRMMNRYVNIYRIIKSHKNYQVATVPTARDFKPTMFVLGVIVGNPEQAKNFVDLLDETKLASMIEFIQTLENPELKAFIIENSDKNAVDDLTTTIVKRNLALISRFSFRTYDAIDIGLKANEKEQQSNG